MAGWLHGRSLLMRLLRNRGLPCDGCFPASASGVKITGMKVFGVSLTPDSDRPYVFVKLETDAGRRRLGRRHARRQGGRGDGLHRTTSATS